MTETGPVSNAGLGGIVDVRRDAEANNPEAAALWLTGMLTLGVAWILVTLTGALSVADRPDAMRRIHNKLVGARMVRTTGPRAWAADAPLAGGPRPGFRIDHPRGRLLLTLAGR